MRTRTLVPVQPPDTYSTADLALAAFLKERGHSLVGIRSELGCGVFVFQDGMELQQDILNWSNDETTLLRPRSFLNNVRDLKGLARGGMR